MKNMQRMSRRQLVDRLLARTALSALGLAATLAGCAVGPDYITPETVVPASFLPPPVAAPSKAAGKPNFYQIEWWRSLGDPELDSLVSRAIESNLDIEIALTRLQEARTQELVVIGEALPAGGGTAGGGGGTGRDLTKGRVSDALRSANNAHTFGPSGQIAVAGGFDATWEIDVFGKYWRELEAATYDAEALAAAREWVLVTVAADVARAYLDMRALQRQLAVLRQNIGVAQGSLDFEKSRFKQGITNELDVALAERHLANLQAEVAPLEAQVSASQHVIAVLLGKFPEDLAKELASPGKLPSLPAQIPAGLPVDLLRRRPDIHAAERQLAAATARIGVATADLFPRVIVSGALGGEGGPSPSSVPLTFIGAAGPAVYWPMLDFGTLDAIADIAELRAHESVTAYKQTILIAVQQVDDAIATYTAEQNRLKNLDHALAAARQATKLATERYNRGLTDYLNVLDAERQQFDLEEEYVASQRTAAEQLIALYKALGGGWELHQAVPPIRQPQPAILAAARRLLDPPATPR
jgi:NodT family efflux transporter outer membrane factor (OMF) lipoprotein